MKCMAMLLVVGLLSGCSPAVGSGDRFVSTPSGNGSIAEWLTSADAHVKLPLAAGLTWSQVPPSPDVLVKAKAVEGPTIVLVARIEGAPMPLAIETCADAHRARIYAAAKKQGIAMTPPEISLEMRKGVKVPRLHYAVPLDAENGALPASLLTSWGYLVVDGQCLGLNVTTVVHGKKANPEEPEPEDLVRLDRVFDLAMDGWTIGKL